MSDLNALLNDSDVQKVIARALELQAYNAQALRKGGVPPPRT